MRLLLPLHTCLILSLSVATATEATIPSNRLLVGASKKIDGDNNKNKKDTTAELSIEGRQQSNGDTPIPANDLCENAEIITAPFVGVPHSSTTIGASLDGVGTCGTVNTAPGVWFTLTGNGEALLASTCSFPFYDTKMSVFTSSCDNLVCVDGNDDSCGLLSEVTWNSTAGQQYYILIHGFADTTGDFELTVLDLSIIPTQAPTALPTVAIETPAPTPLGTPAPTAFVGNNDNCEEATRLILGLPIQDTTSNAEFDDVGVCNGITNTAPGVWFEVFGTGNTLVANTCAFATFDTKISVFGGSCGELACITANDDSCELQSEAVWDSVAGETYYILVHAFASVTGDFELVVNELSSVSNDFCGDAVEILELGVPYRNSTSGASFDDMGTCNGVSNTAPGVWFTLAGTGDALVASTCSFASFDTKISIYSGFCDDLACVSANDDTCDVRSEAIWESQVGETYFILVHGFASLTGDFELIVDQIVSHNDFCLGATSATLGVTYQDSTLNATFDDVGDCGTPNNAPGVWYTIVGTGDTLLASTCSFATFDTKLSVFTGSCDELECVGGNDDSCDLLSEFTWASVEGEAYYVLVHGFSAASGDFELTISEVTVSEVGGDTPTIPSEVTPEPTSSDVTATPEPTSEVPTPVPTPSSTTTSLPTPYVNNDLCDDPRHVELGAIYQDSTDNATLDNAPMCGGSNTAPGVWFAVTGTGSTLIASTCSFATFDTKLSVYTGSCTELVCEAGNDDSCELQSEVTWDSLPDEEYLILVHGFSSSTGEFELMVDEVFDGSTPAPTPSPTALTDLSPNNACSGAVEVTIGEPIQDATTAATTDNMDTCGATNTAPGVWFTVAGTGNELLASTCSFASFDTKISVFSGSCDTPICVGGNDDACELQSEYAWTSSPDEVYFILVHGFGSVTGEFELTVSETTEVESITDSVPEVTELLNDFCNEATALEIGVPSSGSTSLATFDDTDICGATNTAPGVWFSVTGTGQELVASTCSFADFDTKISVFTGSCVVLECVGGNDDFCQLQSEFRWDSTQDEEYYILVHGFGDVTGNFDLTVSETPEDTPSPTLSPTSVDDLSSNNNCDGATELTLGVPLRDTTTSATVDNMGICGASNTAPGVWFTVAGTGTELVASTCSFASFDTKIAVFFGSCDTPICVGGNDDACELRSEFSWDSSADEVYFVLVHGFGSVTGDFEITVSEVGSVPIAGSPPDVTESLNDVCSEATVLEIGVPVSDATTLATFDDMTICGAVNTAPGVWFSITGTGNELVASTCSSADFDTKISVFNGTCDDLDCVGGNDDACGLQSEFLWASSPGEEYYVLVHGFGDITGNFDLTVSEVPAATPPPTGAPTSIDGLSPNNGCAGATEIEVGVPIEDTTTRATQDNMGVCGASNTAAGVWFTLNGTGSELAASTCSFATFDTKISVYFGSCDGLICVGGDDDACDLQSEVVFDSSPDETYFILVHGFGSVTGDFELIVAEVDAEVDTEVDEEVVVDGTTTPEPTTTAEPTTTPEPTVEEVDVVENITSSSGDNDVCTEATELAIGETILDSTDSATFDDVAICGATNTAPGVWFVVTGNGNELVASTCSFASFDTKISVFTGSCDDLDCVGGNDDECDLLSEIRWESSPDEEYLILVHGFGALTGDFELTVSEAGVSDLSEGETVGSGPANVTEDSESANSFCSGATEVELGVPLQDTTTSATFDNTGICGATNTAPGVWFSVVGTGSELVASTCSFAAFDTKISIFTGSCEDLSCLDGNDDACDLQSEIAWQSQLDEEYLILVHGFGSSTGDFELIVQEGSSAESTNGAVEEPADGTTNNDICDGATDVTIGVTIQDSTSSATFDDIVVCGATNTAPGVWFSVIGTGSRLVASTCSFATFDTKISVLTGSSCADLTCVDGNDDSCDLQSEVAWDSVLDEEYFILVHGFGPTTGDFELTVEEVGGSSVAVGGGEEEVESTSSPAPTSSIEPTEPAETPIGDGDNDLCDEATALTIGSPLRDSTSSATFDEIPVCGATITAPGVWYSVTGTDSTLIASTCSFATFDTKISVFEGVCDDLSCISGNDDSCDLQSEVTWEAASGVEYLILVHGFGSTTGDFEIIVVDSEEATTTPIATDDEVLENDTCEEAVLVSPGDTVESTTQSAGFDDVATCGVVNSSPGVWFSVVGTGSALTASTCDSATFDTKISVYTGSCDALECIDGDDDACGLQSEVVWDSIPDQVYYILVHGFGASTGDFEISVGVGSSEVTDEQVASAGTLTPTELNGGVEAEPNDECSGAVTLVLGEPVQGSTSSATFDDVGFCVISNTGPGVWYHISGLNGTLLASTCSSVSFDTKISVFTGSCGALDCVGGDDDSCDLQSEVVWDAVSSEEYFILVHGFEFTTGDFELVVETSDVAAADANQAASNVSDTCEDAVHLSIDVPFSGTTSSASFDDMTFCGTTNTGPGVWFSVDGTGSTLVASTCSFASFDTKISVYSGSCDNPVCVDGNDDECGLQSEVSWESSPDEVYYILVHGFDSTIGDFEIIVTDTGDGSGADSGADSGTDATPPPTTSGTEAEINSICDEAVAIELGTTLPGTTESATFDDLGYCGASNTGPGVWYSVVGTGDPMRASTCSFASFDTKLSIYSGSCDELICVGGNDDACDFQSEVVWDSLADEVYYILVHGFGIGTGDFEISVEGVNATLPTSSPSDESQLTANDACDNATEVTLGVPVQDSTVEATFDNVGRCGTSNTAPGVWFSVVGTGSSLVASTCSFASYDTRISVFTGSCDGLDCVGGDDDSCDIRSEFSWDSSLDEVYLILVHGFGAGHGDFELIVDEVVAADTPSPDGGIVDSTTESSLVINDFCDQAESVSLGQVVEGSTVSATRADVDRCGPFSTSPGVWYSVEGIDGSLHASTCSFASFDTKISVFTGSCAELACVDGNDDSCGFQSEVIWESSSDAVYFILIHGFSSLSGDFELVVEDVSSPSSSSSSSIETVAPSVADSVPNDICNSAMDLTGLFQVESSTTNAVSEDFGICDNVYSAGPGAWFSFVGNGNLTSVNTCSFASFDTQITVFSGFCDNLLCLASNDDSCGIQSEVSLETVEGTTYFVRVSGFAGQSGDFVLSLKRDVLDAVGAPLQNNICDDALALEPPAIYEGSTTGASADTDFCGKAPGAGVWFSVTGTGNNMRASTCNFAAFDTQISVFVGACDDLACVAGNDDACNLQSEVTWETSPGTEYFVLVSGFLGESGEFELSLDSGDFELTIEDVPAK